MSDYFPEEIIHKILLKLPVKSLIKSTLVCKSWMSLIKSSTFIQSHLRSTIDSNEQNDSHLLLLSASSYSKEENIFYQHHWLHWDTPEFGEYSKLSKPVTSFSKKKTVSSDLQVVGICNGLVLLETDLLDSHHLPVLIWNPSIKKIVKLPKPPPCFESTKHDKYTSHGFGYDSVSNDYKVLRIVTLPYDYSDLSRFVTAVQVYSLARGSWRTLAASDVPKDLTGGEFAFVNGSLHSLEARVSVYYFDHADEYRTCGGDGFIACFDLATEVFGEIMRPQALRKDRCSISRYRESLCLIKHYDYHCMDPVNRGCDFWIMKEYGVVESWTYMFNISVVSASVYGFKWCGEVVLKENDAHGQLRMYSVDPKSKEFKIFRTDEEEDYMYYFMDSYVESLVMLDNVNAVSY